MLNLFNRKKREIITAPKDISVTPMTPISDIIGVYDPISWINTANLNDIKLKKACDRSTYVRWLISARTKSSESFKMFEKAYYQIVDIDNMQALNFMTEMANNNLSRYMEYDASKCILSGYMYKTAAKRYLDTLSYAGIDDNERTAVMNTMLRKACNANISMIYDRINFHDKFISYMYNDGVKFSDLLVLVGIDCSNTSFMDNAKPKRLDSVIITVATSIQEIKNLATVIRPDTICIMDLSYKDLLLAKSKLASSTEYSRSIEAILNFIGSVIS